MHTTNPRSTPISSHTYLYIYLGAVDVLILDCPCRIYVGHTQFKINERHLVFQNTKVLHLIDYVVDDEEIIFQGQFIISRNIL